MSTTEREKLEEFLGVWKEWRDGKHPDMSLSDVLGDFPYEVAEVLDEKLYKCLDCGAIVKESRVIDLDMEFEWSKCPECDTGHVSAHVKALDRAPVTC